MDANLVIGSLLEHLKHTECTLLSLRESITILEGLNPVINKKLIATLKKQPKPNAKTWSFKEKVCALLVYKKFTKSYQMLCKIASLPKPNELNEVLSSIPVTTGINVASVNNLKNIAKGVTDDEELEKDKELTCSLIFHKIDLQPHIQYNEAEDRIDGFVDLGDQRSRNFADAAILFIIEGLYTNFSQPISMYFVNDELSSERLSKLIKQNVTAVQGTGFRVMTTICSNTVDNVAALNILSGDAEKHYFECDSKKIYIMYDVPHLFKCIRDHFFEYGQIKFNGVTAKWSHIVKCYEVMETFISFFGGREEYENYVNPCDQKTVSYAAQSLSRSAAVGVHKLALEDENRKIKKEMEETSAVLIELDKLLDLTNGPANRSEIIKGQREKVSKKTDHLDKWASLKTELAKVKFLNSDGKEFEENCIKRYITSLTSLSDIWKETEGLGIRKLDLRKLNIESIENVFEFALVTNPKLTNPKLTCSSFLIAMKLFAASTLF